MLQLAVLVASDPIPSDNDVKAGWGALVLILLLAAACVFLFFSFNKQLRKAKAAADAGVYDEPAPGRGPSGDPQTHHQP